MYLPAYEYEQLLIMLEKQKKILELQGYSVAYICIYGSQNYGLDTYTEEYQSDVDMKAVIVPTLDDLIANSKPISTTVDTEWGQCDLKDIRIFLETLLKANPAYIETLYTPFFVIDKKFMKEFGSIIALRNDLVEALSAQFIRAMYGMMCEKEKALCHPYPTIAHKIEKWGYDGKQAHHILRLWIMMQQYFEDKTSLDNCMYIHDDMELAYELLMKLKLNKLPLHDVKGLVSDIMDMARTFKEEYLDGIEGTTDDSTIKDQFLSLSHSIIKNKIVEDVRGGN